MKQLYRLKLAPKRRVTSKIAAIGSLALVLAACGSSSSASSSSTTAASTNNSSSSSSGSSSAVATASANLAKYSSAHTLSMPGPAFDASKASGKLAWVIEYNAASPAVAVVTQNIEEGLTHEKVKVLTCDAHNVALNIVSCITQGLSQKPAVIIAVGGDPRSFSTGIQAAAAAHVPLISAINVPVKTSANSSTVAPILKGLAANASQPYTLSGILAADMVVKDSNANAHVLFLDSPGILGAQFQSESFASTLKQLCPKCVLYTKGVTLPNWASDVQPTVSAQLQLHPDINYVVPVLDPMAAYAVTAIQQAGKSSSIKIVTADGTPQEMTYLSQGQIIVGEIGQDLPKVGFIAADEALRYMSGVPSSNLVTDAQTGVRVFDSSNISSLSLTPANFTSGDWYTGSPSALADSFYKLWSGK